MNTSPIKSLVLAVVLAACGDDDDLGLEQDMDHASEEPHWSYDDPSNWDELSETWAICGEEHEQSPIDLPSGMSETDLPDLVTQYGESHVLAVNNGHTIRYDYDPGSELVIGEKHYPLVQFHFHAHGEHAIDGQFAPLELHLVHITPEGELAVLGILFEVGAENATLADAAWATLPASGTFENEDQRFDVSELLPGGPTYRYSGSLTTPPCTEGVAWHVFATPVTLSQAQLDAFTTLFDHNYRPLEPLGQRTLSFGS